MSDMPATIYLPSVETDGLDALESANLEIVNPVQQLYRTVSELFPNDFEHGSTDVAVCFSDDGNVAMRAERPQASRVVLRLADGQSLWVFGPAGKRGECGLMLAGTSDKRHARARMLTDLERNEKSIELLELIANSHLEQPLSRLTRVANSARGIVRKTASLMTILPGKVRGTTDNILSAITPIED